MSAIQSTAAAARLGLAASALGLDVQSMVEQLADVAGDLASATAFVDADLATLAIGVELPADEWGARRMAKLTTGISRSSALTRAISVRRGDPWIERGVGPGGTMAEGMAGVYATLAIAGSATLPDDIAAASAIGVDASTCGALHEQLRLLGDATTTADRVVRVTIFSGGEDTDPFHLELGTPAPPDLLARIAAAGDKLAISAAQRRLLDTIHPILANAPPVWMGVRANATSLLPGITIGYGAVPMETAQRVVNGLAQNQDSAMTRFGTIVGALGAGDKLRALTLEPGPTELMRARLALAVSLTA